MKTDKWECTECGAIRCSEEDITEHWIVKHPDPVINLLVTKALTEAIQIYELEKLFARQA